MSNLIPIEIVSALACVVGWLTPSNSPTATPTATPTASSPPSPTNSVSSNSLPKGSNTGGTWYIKMNNTESYFALTEHSEDEAWFLV